jgi:mannosylglycerate hydrolase
MTPSPLEVYVVAHTHWDREWYHPAERFRQRLVGLIDELLRLGTPAGQSFLLDGQAVLLDDYLQVRPEKAPELAAVLREGLIEAGPWYVLPDELIPSGEALVRNLLAGRALIRQLGGEPPPVLYCPDSFGHPAALPDVANGFDYNLVVLWRGYGGARWPAGDTVRWRGPSGHEAIVYHLPPDGYEFGSTLPTHPDEVKARWERLAAVLAPRATTGVVLLLNGADHHARQWHQREALHALAQAATPAIVGPSTLRGAATAIVAAATRTALPEVRGELRDSYGYTWTLQGTLGTRAAQKRRNACAERLLIRDVEPWLALAIDEGSAEMPALLRAAWRTLLRAHPHDTLCGTSIDAVAHAFDARLAATEVQGIGLRDDALLTLLGYGRERTRPSPSEWRPVVVLRNPAARIRGGVAELTLSATIADVAVGPGSAERQGDAHRVPPWRVQGVPIQILSRSERVALTESPRAYPDADRVAEVRALGWIESMPGYGVETRPQRGGGRVSVANPVRAEAGELENGHLRVVVSQAGSVRLEDRANGRVIDGLITLEQHRDAGDLYTPAPREPLPPPRVRRVKLVHRGPLRGELALHLVYASPDRATGGTCRISLQLDADLPALRIAVEGDNRACDHRLRLRVATGLAGAVTIADAAFHPVTRAPLDIPADDARMEQVVHTAPLHRWVARFTGSQGATLFSDGLAEYESTDDGAIAVTLIRAVGALSLCDLPERPGHAGWPADTPEAQSLGPFSARFALALHGPDDEGVRDEIERLADDVLVPIVGETLRADQGEPRRLGGIELSGEGLVFSAAAPAQLDGWLMLRCVNRRDARVHGQWRVGRELGEARLARLDETPLGALTVDGGVIEFFASPHEIVTIVARYPDTSKD